MRNFIQEGEVVTLPAPYAVASGDGALVGSLFGVATSAYAKDEAGEFALEGVFRLTATPADVGAVGAKIYWDNTAKRCTTTATSNTLIGALTFAKAANDATAAVRLNGAVA